MKLTAFGHKTFRKCSQYFRQVSYHFSLDPPQHQRIADPLDFDILRPVYEAQFFGDAHGQRIATFENSGQHGIFLKILVYTVYTQLIRLQFV